MAGYTVEDFGAEDIEALALELGLTERQVRAAYSRALRRTAVTLRTKAQRGLKSEFGVRKIRFLRKRLKYLGFRKLDAGGGTARLWFGLNDVPVSALTGSKRKTAQGAVFSGKAGSVAFKGGFIRDSQRGFGRTIFMREGRARLPLKEAEVPIHERAEQFVEDQIFTDIIETFWHHFMSDMKARARGYGS